MKQIALFAALFLLNLPAFARLDENLDQLVKRYGVRPKIRVGKGGEIWTFTTPQLIIEVQAVGFGAGVSKIETYRKRSGEKFTVEEVTAMLIALDRDMDAPKTESDGTVWWELRLKVSRTQRPDALAILEADAKSFSVGPGLFWRERPTVAPKVPEL